MATARNLAFSRQADSAFARVEKISAEVLFQTFSALVAAISAEVESPNEEIGRVGRRLGVRLSDEMIAKFASGLTIGNFTEACDVVVKIGLKVYLGLASNSTAGSGNSHVYSFVADLEGTSTSGQLSANSALSVFLCGVVTGVLSQLGYVVKVAQTEDSNAFTIELQE